VREAVRAGTAPEDALVMATLNPCLWHGLAHLGAVAPGYQADLLLLPDLERFEPELVLKSGRPVGDVARIDVPEWLRHTVRIDMSRLGLADFRIPWQGGRARVIGVVPGQIVTEEVIEQLATSNGFAVAEPARDLAKIAVVERHLGTGRVGLGLVRGFGLARGALASTVSHDAHNVLAVGISDEDLVRAVGRLAELGGGIVVVADEAVLAELPLPVAGLLSDEPFAQVVAASQACVAAARSLGCMLESPFQTMAFLALSVIPKLKLTDRGLVDVDRFELVSLRAD
jgi:adenine deaminase